MVLLIVPEWKWQEHGGTLNLLCLYCLYWGILGKLRHGRWMCLFLCVCVCFSPSHRVQPTKVYPTLRKSKRSTTYPERTFHNPKYSSDVTSRWASQPICDYRFGPQLSQQAVAGHNQIYGWPSNPARILWMSPIVQVFFMEISGWPWKNIPYWQFPWQSQTSFETPRFPQDEVALVTAAGFGATSRPRRQCNTDLPASGARGQGKWQEVAWRSGVLPVVWKWLVLDICSCFFSIWMACTYMSIKFISIHIYIYIFIYIHSSGWLDRKMCRWMERQRDRERER